MSDTTTMPFQPRTMEHAPEAPELDDSPGNQRVLLLLGALGGLAVLAIAAYFLVFAGGDDKAPKTTAPAPGSVVQPSTAPSTAPDTAALPKISKRNFGTDPFKPLIVDTTTDTTTGTTAGTTTSPTTTTPITTTPTTAPPVATPPAYRFRVVSVAGNNKSAHVKVNGTAYAVGIGEVFSGKFKAVRFSGGSCGTFKFGDEPIYLCEGNAVSRN